MALSTLSSSPGRLELIFASALLIALTQELVDSSTHVSMTLLNPTSLPPTVIETSVVALLSAEIWPLRTVLVVAPAQATDV